MFVDSFKLMNDVSCSQLDVGRLMFEEDGRRRLSNIKPVI